MKTEVERVFTKGAAYFGPAYSLSSAPVPLPSLPAAIAVLARLEWALQSWSEQNVESKLTFDTQISSARSPTFLQACPIKVAARFIGRRRGHLRHI
jgi:hypothetical protein